MVFIRTKLNKVGVIQRNRLVMSVTATFRSSLVKKNLNLLNMACMIYDKTSLTTSITTLSKFSDKYLPVSWTCRRVFLRVRWLFAILDHMSNSPHQLHNDENRITRTSIICLEGSSLLPYNNGVNYGGKTFSKSHFLRSRHRGTYTVWSCTILTRNAWNFKSHLRAVVYKFLVWFSFQMFFVIIIHPLSKIWGSSAFLYLTL